ncbi:hypothetical protein HYR82_01810 [Candidatus Peregrinibacteria bacterium]|nr:hypothetical protein [Candidatus Peregrinibacteria bacterium]
MRLRPSQSRIVREGQLLLQSRFLESIFQSATEEIFSEGIVRVFFLEVFDGLCQEEASEESVSEREVQVIDHLLDTHSFSAM